MARRTLHARLHSGKLCMGSLAPCYPQGAPVTIFLVTRAWLFGAMLPAGSAGYHLPGNPCMALRCYVTLDIVPKDLAVALDPALSKSLVALSESLVALSAWWMCVSNVL